MADAALVWSGDLGFGAGGDLLLTDGPQLTQQRILRRLLTSPGTYVWQLPFGGGLGQFVGAANAGPGCAAVILGQLKLEAAVAALPVPNVSLQTMPDGSVTVGLRYADAAGGGTQLLSFSMST